MKFIFGLGNPDPHYQFTRHNLGFMVIDNLASKFGVEFIKEKFNSQMTLIQTLEAVLIKPLTYMNRSGIAVRQFVHYYGISRDEFIVVCDEIALSFGTIRIGPRGGDGGHKGLRSIILELGTKEFSRLRCGIGPLPPQRDLVEFVLSEFSKEELPQLKDMLERATLALECFISKDLQTAMNLYNCKKN